MLVGDTLTEVDVVVMLMLNMSVDLGREAKRTCRV